MTLRADVFPKLWTRKSIVRCTCKVSPFKGPFEKQHGKRAEKLLKSEREYLSHIYKSRWQQLSWKKSLLVICKMLRLFVNTFTADDKYSVLNRDNLTQPIQMQLSQKQKVFSQCFSALLKSELSFQHFQKKDDRHSWHICKLTDSEKRG